MLGVKSGWRFASFDLARSRITLSRAKQHLSLPERQPQWSLPFFRVPRARQLHAASKQGGPNDGGNPSSPAQLKFAVEGAQDESSRPASTKPRSQNEIHFIPPASLALFRETVEPTPKQLSYAREFFKTNPPSLFFSASRFLHMPMTQVPEIAFLGRSNVGKSSLLNALFRANICHTSGRPGRTRTMNAFSLGPPGAGKHGLVNVLDMPGYGHGSREEWGTEIVKYLTQRKELKRAFVLVDAMHWLKGTDVQLLQMLGDARIPHQVVLSKIDRVLFPGKAKPPLTEEKLQPRLKSVRQKLEQIDETLIGQPRVGKSGGVTLPAFGQVVACAAELGKWRHLGESRLGALGMDNLRWVVLQAVGLTPKEMGSEDEVETSAG